MRRIKLDRIDRRILRNLQADGRMTNVELSRRAGISAPPCLRRVRALEEAGIIRGYHADLAPGGAGLRRDGLCPSRVGEPGGGRPQGLRAAGRHLARGARSAHADRRSRFPAEDRRRRLGQLSTVSERQADLGAQCQPCQIGADPARIKGRTRDPDRRPNPRPTTTKSPRVERTGPRPKRREPVSRSRR